MTITNQKPMTPAADDQSQVDERLRQAILDKKQAQIEAWTAQIEQLRQRVSDVAADVREETEQRMQDLVTARDKAVTELEKLRQSTEQTWAEMLNQTDASFQQLADRFHAFAQRYS